MKADLPDNEESRLNELYLYEILDTLPEQIFDDLTLLASTICQTSISVISFVDKDRQWFKSKVGLEADQTSRDIAFCSHAILKPETMIIPDATLDERFVDNPLVTGDLSIKFYAGTPLITKSGHALGTLCVIDNIPHDLTNTQIKALEALGRQVMSQVESRLNKKIVEEKVLKDQENQKIINYERLKFDSLLIDAPVAICLLEEPNHTIKFMNQLYQKLVGGRKILNKNLRDALPELAGQNVYEQLDIVYATKKSHIENEMLITIDNTGTGVLEKLYLTLIYQPFFDINNIIKGVSLFAFDVTEQVHARKEIERLYKEVQTSNESLKNFAHVASHDLQEPLRTISSYTRLLEKNYAELFDSDAKEFMNYITDGTVRMKSLIEGILNYSKIQLKQKNIQEIDLNYILKSVKLTLQTSIEENNVSITSEDLPSIKIESTHALQLFQNIIGNAIKYRKKDINPIINISVNKKDDEYIFSVNDNGIGINHEYFERIFQLFQRLHGIGEYKGTGIGLSNCKKIVELYNGRIWVESQENKGSTFYFSLPV